jgi:hypothetical protein
MKKLLVLIFCFIALKAFSQTSDAIVEEKSSDWIKVTFTPPTPKPKQTTTVRKRTNTNKPSTPKQNSQDEFEKTNSQVNRFKKVKKG